MVANIEHHPFSKSPDPPLNTRSKGFFLVEWLDLANAYVSLTLCSIEKTMENLWLPEELKGMLIQHI